MTEKTQRYHIDTGQQIVEADAQTYRGIICTWDPATSDGSLLRGVIDALSDEECVQVVAGADADELEITLLWRSLPPQRYWTMGKPPQIGGFYPTMHGPLKSIGAI